jgi:hypothetical protein
VFDGTLILLILDDDDSGGRAFVLLLAFLLLLLVGTVILSRCNISFFLLSADGLLVFVILRFVVFAVDFFFFLTFRFAILVLFPLSTLD